MPINTVHRSDTKYVERGRSIEPRRTHRPAILDSKPIKHRVSPEMEGFLIEMVSMMSSLPK
jgi:hypothetical protein